MLCGCNDWQVEEAGAAFTHKFIRADVVLRRILSHLKKNSAYFRLNSANLTHVMLTLGTTQALQLAWR